MTLATPDENKKAYSQLHDEITDKRFRAPSPIRRHAHHMQYAAVAEQIPMGATVLDAGCGEGVLSVMLAKRGCRVTGVDLSEPNIAAANAYAASEGVSVTFVVGDAEHLPAADKSFDYVVSSHVLEHLPEFTQGVREIARVASKGAVIAIPTCLNMCAMVLLGRDNYWQISRRTPYAFFVGLFRVIGAYFSGEEGVNEGYAGRPELVHIWRFPRRGRMLLEQGGLRVKRYRASSLVFPYLPFLVPLSRVLEKGVWLPVIRNCGYGTTYVCDIASQA